MFFPLKQTIDQPVAVFDSGVGGLSVLKELLAQMPCERFVFVADEAHLPYGDKAHDFLQARVLALVQAIYAMPTKALVLACNTATAAAVEALRATWPQWPVIGIEPAIKPAISSSRSGVVAVLATAHTLASQRFQNLVQACASELRVLPVACSGLVELIEAEFFDRAAVLALLKPIVTAVLEQGADVLVLGCTHYPFVDDCIAECIQQYMAQNNQTCLPAMGFARVLEPSKPVAKQTRLRLQQTGLLCQDEPNLDQNWACFNVDRVQFFTTGNRALFAQKIERLLGQDWAQAQVHTMPNPTGT